MMKRTLCLLAALLLVFAVPAAADEAAEPVTAAELGELLETVRTRALESALLNDPAGEDAQSEDGTLFQYEIARIYAEGTKLGADTPVNALVFDNSEGPVFRSTGLDCRLSDLFLAFPAENPSLAGTREEALLYLRDTSGGGFVYGRVLRDGERVSTVEYAEMVPEGKNFRCVSVTYTMLAGLVTSIRMEGLNPGAEPVSASHTRELYAALKELAATDVYRAAEFSLNGLELTAFNAGDLIFDGFSYTALQPSTLPDDPESELMDNEDGTWLLRCDGDGYQAVFLCDENGENAKVLSLTLLDDETEGPRHVRIGDLFSEDFNRFRNGENEMNEDLTEVLYGIEGVAPWGFADFDPSSGETNLRYVTAVPDGYEVELLLKYVDNNLTEIILHTL